MKIYKQEMITLLKNPTVAQDEYIKVILDRSLDNVKHFLDKHAIKPLTYPDEIKVLKLLEMRRHAMLMFTSCGWFFDEISGIETMQVMQYAARAMQLCSEVSNHSLETEFIGKLENAPSNLADFQDGGQIYKKYIQPTCLDLLRVGAHYAVSSIFEDYPETLHIYSYRFESEMYELLEAGQLKLALGRAFLVAGITWEQANISFAVLHLTGHILNGGVRMYRGDVDLKQLHDKFKKIFQKSDIPEIIRLMDEEFGTHNYTLWHLFKDERRKVFNQILGSRLEDLEITFRKIYDTDYPLLQAMTDMQIPIPKALATPVEFTLNIEIERLFNEQEIDIDQLNKLVGEFRKWRVQPNKVVLDYAISGRIHRLMLAFFEQSGDIRLMKTIQEVIQSLEPLNLNPDLRDAQNLYFISGRKLLGEMERKLEQGNEFAQEWLQEFNNLGCVLRVRLA